MPAPDPKFVILAPRILGAKTMHACSVLGACQSIDKMEVSVGLSGWTRRENQQISAIRILCEPVDAFFQGSEGFSSLPMFQYEEIILALEFYPKLRETTFLAYPVDAETHQG